MKKPRNMFPNTPLPPTLEGAKCVKTSYGRPKAAQEATGLPHYLRKAALLVIGSSFWTLSVSPLDALGITFNHVLVYIKKWVPVWTNIYIYICIVTLALLVTKHLRTKHMFCFLLFYFLFFLLLLVFGSPKPIILDSARGKLEEHATRL